MEYEEKTLAKKRILLIDDDKDLSMITRDMLQSYRYEVSIVSDCDSAYQLLEKEQFHLLILDINLPDGTGFEICRELRRVLKVPIIFASARTSEDDKIAGLNLGGDDYLAKPYSLKELLARVNALMRRTYGEEQETVYEIGDIRVNVGLRRVEKAGMEIHLALKEFDVLAYLCAHAGKAVTKEELLHEVWGAFSEAEIATVAVHIRWLREKLERDASKPVLIKTVWGVGYMLEDKS